MVAATYPDFEDAFVERISHDAAESVCWIWAGCHDTGGYGNVVVPQGFPGAGASRRMKAHRVAWILWVAAPVELERVAILQVHHVCEIRDCVRPCHLMALSRVAHYLEHHPDADFVELDPIW